MLRIDTSDKKIGAFISAIVTLVLSAIALYVCFGLSQDIHSQSGLESLSQLITVPLLIILYVVCTCFTISSVLSSFMAVFSTSKAIKIISIILILISIGALGFEIYTITLVL